MPEESRPQDAPRAAASALPTVLIVTYQSAEHVARCLECIPAEYPVVVVDNASSDGSADRVVSARPSTRVVLNDTNTGFAAAVNQGMATIETDRDVVLLNPDAALEPGALEALAACDEPDAALISALVLDRTGRPERYASGRAPTVGAMAVHYLGLGRVLGRVLGRWSLYTAAPVDRRSRPEWVAGTCVLVRRAPWEAVSGFDEGFFLYAEDIDLAMRLAAQGWSCVVEPRARVRHLGGASVASAPAIVDEHRIGSLDALVVRHRRPREVVAVRGIRVLGFLIRALVFSAVDPPRGRRYRRDTLLSLRLLRRPTT